MGRETEREFKLKVPVSDIYKTLNGFVLRYLNSSYKFNIQKTKQHLFQSNKFFFLIKHILSLIYGQTNVCLI